MNRNPVNVRLVPIVGAQAIVFSSPFGENRHSAMIIQERNVPCRDTHQKRHPKYDAFYSGTVCITLPAMSCREVAGYRNSRAR